MDLLNTNGACICKCRFLQPYSQRSEDALTEGHRLKTATSCGEQSMSAHPVQV